jgi:hypothetical protein
MTEKSGGGSLFDSIAIIALSTPLHNSSQNFILRIMEARSSFLDRGGASMNLVVSMRGIPGFVISIRFKKISIKGPVPVILRS